MTEEKVDTHVVSKEEFAAKVIAVQDSNPDLTLIECFYQVCEDLDIDETTVKNFVSDGLKAKMQAEGERVRIIKRSSKTLTKRLF